MGICIYVYKSNCFPKLCLAAAKILLQSDSSDFMFVGHVQTQTENAALPKNTTLLLVVVLRSTAYSQGVVVAR